MSVLDRVTSVFEAFGEYGEGLGVSELARRANLPKSTVSRIAADLVGRRLLDRYGDKLYLGVGLFELGQYVEQPRKLRELAPPVMAELRNATGETVHLGVLDAVDVVVVAIVRGGPALKPLAMVGRRLPAHATALGKAMLAFSDREVVELVVNGGLASRTRHTISEPSALVHELTEIRRVGVATEREECTTGRACMASPILGYGAAPIAAISVAGSVADMDPDRLVPAVRTAAMTLSRRVGAMNR